MSALSTYRQDIDGLRAVAVSIIVLFHCGVHVLSGGYVGVDVFFVISGFLITSQIHKSLNKGSFSFKDFYLRRLRRLGPSLFATLALTLIVGFVLFSPEHYERLGKSALAGLLSVANIFFWTEAGYFDEAAIVKPLLHLWSLGVEEQYYLIWPLILVLLARKARLEGIALATVALGALSLIGAELVMPHDPAAAFYLMPFRLAEFGCGAFLAVANTTRVAQGPAANPMSIGGLVMVLVSALVLTEETRFPGITAMIPALGTAMLIAAGPNTVVNRVLSVGFMRYIGNISYSLYLVHWPIIVFYTYRFGPAHQATDVIGLVLASVALGALLYHFVETPFRQPGKNGFRISTKALGRASIAVAVSLIAACAVIIDQRGLPQRLSPEIVAIDQNLKGAGRMRRENIRQTTCHFASRNTVDYFEHFENCQPDGDARKTVVVGDSHGADIWAALNAGDTMITAQLTGAGCNTALARHENLNCQRFAQFAEEWMAENADVLENIIFAVSPNDLVKVNETTGIQTLAPDSIFVEFSDYFKDLEKRDAKITVIGPRPRMPVRLSQLIAVTGSIQHLRAEIANIDISAYRLADQRLAELFAGTGINYISSVDALCDEETCDFLYEDSQPLYTDNWHFTPDGGRFFIDRILPELPIALSPNERK